MYQDFGMKTDILHFWDLQFDSGRCKYDNIAVSHVYVDIKGAAVKPYFCCIKRFLSIRAAVLPPGGETCGQAGLSLFAGFDADDRTEAVGNSLEIHIFKANGERERERRGIRVQAEAPPALCGPRLKCVWRKQDVKDFQTPTQPLAER